MPAEQPQPEPQPEPVSDRPAALDLLPAPAEAALERTETLSSTPTIDDRRYLLDKNHPNHVPPHVALVTLDEQWCERGFWLFLLHLRFPLTLSTLQYQARFAQENAQGP